MTSQPRRHASMQVERSSVMEISLIVITSSTESKDSETKRPTSASSCRLVLISLVALDLEVVEDVIFWAEVADKSLVGEMSMSIENKAGC
mmetsp:Transcript_12801/g.18361  ORF Transcript_12801/g.18361 Transcript_12801/m.18361 type:complete len:90 (+) Transcript_12801:3882-4151(+)